MAHADLIAAFIAKNGVTRVEAGVRAVSDREIYRAAREGGKALTIAEQARRLVAEEMRKDEEELRQVERLREEDYAIRWGIA
jgi:hypothetical protein